MPNKKPNFLESIEFQEDFSPFKKGNSIKFGGEKEVQNMIEFYLKNKGIKNYKENAQRFKINCVLGNNGGGKSRLFEWIYRFLNTGITEGEILRKPIFNGNVKIGHNVISYPNHNHLHHFTNNGNGTGNLLGSLIDSASEFENLCILNDDFFKLSGNIKFSVNEDILNNKNYNKFYCNLFNDIGKFNKIYPGFLNISNEFSTKIKFNFINWKDNYKGDYFDFLNYHNDYNEEIDKYNVKDEINFGESLNFFELLAKTYNNENTTLHSFGIKKEEAKEIWLYLSELFLLTVNHFDRYVSIDDKFIKEMILGRKSLGGNQEGFKEKGLFSYDAYVNYKKSLHLLEIYLNININLLNKNLFSEYYLHKDKNKENINSSLEQIKFNLKILLQNLEEIEKEVLSNEQNKKEYGYLKYKQKYFFKDIHGNQNKLIKFIDKLQGSKYSSQSKYLLINLLFGYSDIDQYTSDIHNNSYSDKDIEINKNKIKELNWYVFDGPVHFFSKTIINKNFGYEGCEILNEDIINFLHNNFINCDIEFIDKKNKKSFEILSAGEKTMLTRFTNISRYIFESKKTDFLILIDEPDLHLHLDWQRQYIQKLIDVFSTLDSEINLHFIIATHSPFIISDLPKESLVLLNKGEQVDNKEIPETFGANYIDIIKNGFFFEDKMLMGSFAQENIEKASKKLKAKLFIETLGINKDNFNDKKTFLNNILEEIGENKINDFGEFENNKDKYFDGVENIQNHIGDDFLQDNLMYLK